MISELGFQGLTPGIRGSFVSKSMEERTEGKLHTAGLIKQWIVDIEQKTVW
jgi:hypothetical protein